MSTQNCSCGALCSEVEELSGQVARLNLALALRCDEVAYLRKDLGIDAYGNKLEIPA
jgi:hypothetical protein